MDTKKLRQKILDLAIRGKLVPQDPNDEPASVLLERIRAEKERLIKEGKIKRSKKTAEDNKIEVPFEVPESWEWVRLDDLCDIKGGKRIPHGMNSSKVPTEHVYLRVTNMKSHTIIENEIKYIDEEVFQIIKNYTISSDDLYLTIAGTIGDVGVIPLKFSNMNLTENAAKLTNIFCDKRFLMYALLSTAVQDHFSSKFHQVAQPKLSIETASSAIIALPPIIEQKRIANEVERWFSVIDELESNEDDLLKAIDKAKSKILDLAIHGKLVPQDPNDEPAIELLKRINPMFEPCNVEDCPFAIPPSWEWTTIGMSSKYKSASIDPSKYKDQDFELYSVPSFETGMPEVVKGTSISSSKKIVKEGDVLVCKINPHLNRIWIVEHHNKDLQCIASSEWIIFRNRDIDSQYLMRCFSSSYFLHLMLSNVSGVGGSLMRAQPASVEKYLFPLPPLAEQKRIVAKIEEVFKALDALS